MQPVQGGTQSFMKQINMVWKLLSLSLSLSHTQCHLRCLNLTDNNNQLISIPFSDTNLPNIYSLSEHGFWLVEISNSRLGASHVQKVACFI